MTRRAPGPERMPEPPTTPPEDPADDRVECGGCGFDVDLDDTIPVGLGRFCADQGCSVKATLDTAPADLSTWHDDLLSQARLETRAFVRAIEREERRREEREIRALLRGNGGTR